MIYMFLSNNPSLGDINSSNLSCLFVFLLILARTFLLGNFRGFIEFCIQHIKHACSYYLILSILWVVTSHEQEVLKVSYSETWLKRPNQIRQNKGLKD